MLGLKYKLGVIIWSILICQSSVANNNQGNKPYLGINYKLSYTEGRNYWKKLLPTNKIYQHVGLFSGIKLDDFIAAEIGYTSSFNITKHSALSGVTMWGNIAPTYFSQELKLTYKNWNFDLNLFYPNHRGMALLLTLGIDLLKPKIVATNISGSQNNAVINQISGRRQFSPKVGAGFQIIGEIMGIRSRVIWVDHSRTQLNTGALNGVFPQISPHPFKNGYLWDVSLFFFY